MLKNKTTRIIIGIVIVLGVLAASSIWVSHAFKENSVDDFNYSNLDGNANASTTAVTQIDHIIDNSNKADSDERENYDTSKYYIYVIVPKSSAVREVAQLFTNNDYFQKKVIDENRNIDATMADGKIQVVVKTVQELNTSSNPANDLADADLIYLYTGSDQKAYTKGSDSEIGEDLYEALHNYAFGSKKPLLMDYAGLQNNGAENDDGGKINGSNSNMYTLTAIDFKNSWRRYKTINVSTWDESVTGTDDFDELKAYLQNPVLSVYPSYEANNNTLPSGYDSWEMYWKRTGSTEKTLNVLYITGENRASQASADQFANWMIDQSETGGCGIIFDKKDTPIENLPTVAKTDIVNADTLTVDDLYAKDENGNIMKDALGNNVQKYDFIFIAPDTNKYKNNNDIHEDVKDELIKLSSTVANDHEKVTSILYATITSAQTVTPGTSGGHVTESLTFDTSTNFGKLLDLSLTTTGYAKKNNILVVGTQFMKTMSSIPDANLKKIAKIVSLINKSRYRTYAGSGDSSDSGSISTTAYRVLELQPCYPIDLEKALASGIKTELTTSNGTNGEGNYYTVPANVLNTTEIDNFVDSNGTVSGEYYQWDLSKAKLAYALNIPADSIELVQMSTEEFITSKADVTNNYDLIYIGGNKSALKVSGIWNKYPFPQTDDKMISAGNELDAKVASLNTASYTMYSHTGEIVGLVSGQTFSFNRDYASTTLNGNDITYDQLLALKKYIDADMPIVFSNELWTAYTDAATNKYSNRYIDPDSNMYKLLSYADDSKNALTNWAIKEKSSSTKWQLADYWVMTANQEQKVTNAVGKYGAADTVTVFNDTLSAELRSYVNASERNARPKYTIDTNAVAYQDGVESTKLKDRNLKWTVTLLNPKEGHNYQAFLLEDLDDNAIFDFENEKKVTANFSNGVATLEYTYPADDFGAFSWKVLVVDTGSNTTATTSMPATGTSEISMIARDENQPKKTAHILEIMPIVSSKAGGQDGHTLYLDSNIQDGQGAWKFKYSTYLNENANADGTYSENPNSGYGYAPVTTSEGGSYYKYETVTFTEKGTGAYAPYQLEKYQPKLSLNRYDATTNREDWTYNYVDLIKDDFDVSLDIMYVDDLEYYAAKSRETTPTQRAEYLQLADEAKEVYDAYNTPGKAEYNALYTAESDLRDTLIKIRDGGANDVVFSYVNPYNTSLMVDVKAGSFSKTDLDGIISSGDYFRFFFENWPAYGKDAEQLYNNVYVPYRNEHDKMVDAYRRYIHFSMLAYGPKEYLAQNFDVIAIGFYDDANGQFVDFSTNLCTDIQSFLDANGSILMTHDNMTKDMTKGAVNLTNTLRKEAGMYRFGDVEIASGTESSDIPHYITSDNDRYFFSNLSMISGKETGKSAVNVSASEWKTRIDAYVNARKKVADNGSSKYKFGYPGYADCFSVYENRQASNMPYIYAEFQIEEQVRWNLAPSDLRITGTTKATQVNRGVVTTYPYYVSSDLRISPTHNQAYSLNLEDDQVTVWYTFAGDSRSGLTSSGGSSANYLELKNNSSLYAASPKDGMDSYFIYSVGNITYCGAGHSLVTGDNRDNNDERKLFLNVLVNLATKTQRRTEPENDIIIYEPDGKTKAPGDTIKYDKNTDEYSIKVKSSESYPEFAVGLTKGKSYTVKDVDVFYCLDFVSGTFVQTDLDVPIVVNKDDMLATLNAGGVYVINHTNCPALQSKAEYFAPYNGEYTYIRIRITLTDANGNEQVLNKYIKVILTKELLDLT